MVAKPECRADPALQSNFIKRLCIELGDQVVAIHWDLAIAELRKARGMPVVVGLAADRPDEQLLVPATAANVPR